MIKQSKAPLSVELTRLYELSKRHLLELMFFDDELKFLKLLLEKYFGADLHDSYFNKISMISSKLTEISLIRNNINTDALQHQGNLEAYFKAKLVHNSYFYEMESDRISQEIHDIEHQFRKVKSEIFQLFKTALEKAPTKN